MLACTIYFSSSLEFVSFDIENENGGSTLPFDASVTRFCSGRSVDPKQSYLNRPYICTMTSFYYYNQNPSGFCFLVKIRAGITKFKYERILVVVVKRGHRANGLFWKGENPE